MSVMVSLVFLTFAPCINAQQNNPGSQLFDLHGDFPCDHTLALLDAFAIELDKSPQAKGYVIGYAGRNDGVGRVPHRLAHAESYLTSARGISRDRIVTVEGGVLGDFGALREEYWIVPEGAAPPAIRPTRDANFNVNVARKYDEAYARFVRDSGEFRFSCCDICPLEMPDMKSYAKAVKQANARALVILYPAADNFELLISTDSGAHPERRRFSTIARILRLILVRDYGLATGNIDIVLGGKRENPTMELWLLPQGAVAPQPTPARALRTHRKRRRRAIN